MNNESIYKLVYLSYVHSHYGIYKDGNQLFLCIHIKSNITRHHFKNLV